VQMGFRIRGGRRVVPGQHRRAHPLTVLAPTQDHLLQNLLIPVDP
jgi:hypothetical protein